jgi:hypothetical protein
MQQAQGNFTPEQLIVAARRAEAQGQPAYALQFYRFIADNFSSTTEAYEARDAIYRLSPPDAPTASAANGYPVNGYAPAPPASQTADYRTAPSLEAGPGPSHVRPATSERKAKKTKAAAASVEADDDYADSDRPAPGYRIGRLVAAMLSTMGWLMFLGAVAMVPLMFAALTVKSLPKGLREAIASNLLVVGGGTFGMLFLGLMAIFAAQAARATFDTADAVRHLLDTSGR